MRICFDEKHFSQHLHLCTFTWAFKWWINLALLGKVFMHTLHENISWSAVVSIIYPVSVSGKVSWKITKTSLSVTSWGCKIVLASVVRPWNTISPTHLHVSSQHFIKACLLGFPRYAFKRIWDPWGISVTYRAYMLPKSHLTFQGHARVTSGSRQGRVYENRLYLGNRLP